MPITNPTPHPTPARLRAASILVVLALLLTALTACKVVVTIPYGGRVVSEDGFVCEAGDTCEIDVSDATFDSTFTAVPAPAYSFSRWRARPAGFCGNATTPCYLSTTGFDGNDALQEFLDSDELYYLEPVFIHYNLGYWRKVQKEILEGSFATASFLYALKPNIANCDPGALKDAAKGRALQALNQTRTLHHLPAVTRDAFYDMQMQETSLVQRANNYLGHKPSSGDACYTAGALAGASTSNLHGDSGKPSDPAADVFGWTNDNFNVAALMEAGHRRWMLYPQLDFTSYGQVEGFSALKVFGFGTPAPSTTGDLAYVAMPFESYPYVLVSKGSAPTPWSFSMAPPAGMSSSFNYFQNASVSITDNDTGKKLAVQNLHKDNKGFGLSNFLSWMVPGWDYDRPYTVKISAVSLPGGNVRDIEYSVLIDRYNVLDLNYPLEPGDSQQTKSVQGSFNSPLDRDSYKVSITGNRTISGQSEFSNQAFFMLIYDSGKRLVKSSDSAFSGNFAFGQHTLVVSPCDENGLCYQSTRTYRVNIN
jgi:hypothetical protein